MVVPPAPQFNFPEQVHMIQGHGIDTRVADVTSNVIVAELGERKVDLRDDMQLL